MLQQTQVATVLPYWKRWMRRLPGIGALARARSATLHKLWEGLGYYTRVRNMHRAAGVIQREHAGQFPRDYDAVLALPGIGRYTAGAICSIAFNQPKPILDGNVIRVLARVFGIRSDTDAKETRDRLWSLAGSLVEAATRNKKPNSCSHLNQSLMELGALVCVPRQPKCELCPLRKLCYARKHELTAVLPMRSRRPAVTEVRVAAFVLQRSGQFLVQQRPPNVVNAYLWEFPNREINGAPDAIRDAARELFKTLPPELKPLCVFKHSITRYRITLEAWSASVPADFESPLGVWRSPAQLRRLAFTSAQGRILKILKS